MSCELREYLQPYFNKQFNTIFIIQQTKNKKNTFTLKDGIIKLKISFFKDKIECNWCTNPKLCSLKKCKHIYFLLINHYKLSIDELCLLWRDNNWEIFFEDKQKKPNSYLNEDCGICLEEIEQNNYVNFTKIYQCLDCSNFTHHKCLKQINKDHCIFCYKDNKPSLPF
jgi:hypothetical protein